MLTIRSLSARGVLAPLPRPIVTASGTVEKAPILLLDLTTEEGVTGRAYNFGYNPASLQPMAAFAASLSKMLAGRPAAPADIYNETRARFRLMGVQGLVGMVLSGLDMALWDAMGRAADMPVAELLGSAPRPLPAYDSQGAFRPGQDEAAAEAALAAGYSALKLRPGMGDLDFDVAAMTRLREVVGEGTRVMVDYNQSLDAPEAIRRAERLHEFDLYWLEEPVPAEDLTGHAAVNAASPIPVQTGENWWMPEGAGLSIAMEASTFVMPDLGKIGGVTGFMRVAAMADAAGLPLSSHLYPEASAHVLAAAPAMHYLEYLDFAGAILADPARPESGEMTERGPGLGIDWNEKAVERYLV